MLQLYKQLPTAWFKQSLNKRRHDVLCGSGVFQSVIHQYSVAAPSLFTNRYRTAVIGKFYTGKQHIPAATWRSDRVSTLSFLSLACCDNTAVTLAAAVAAILGNTAVDLKSVAYHAAGLCYLLKRRVAVLRLNTNYMFRLSRRGLRRLQSRWMRKGLKKLYKHNSRKQLNFVRALRKLQRYRLGILYKNKRRYAVDCKVSNIAKYMLAACELGCITGSQFFRSHTVATYAGPFSDAATAWRRPLVKFKYADASYAYAPVLIQSYAAEIMARSYYAQGPMDSSIYNITYSELSVLYEYALLYPYYRRFFIKIKNGLASI